MRQSYFKSLTNSQRKQQFAAYLTKNMPFLSQAQVQSIITARVNLLDGTTAPLIKFQWTVHHLEEDLTHFRTVTTMHDKGVEFTRTGTEIRTVMCGTWILGGGKFGLDREVKVVPSVCSLSPTFKKACYPPTIPVTTEVQCIAVITSEWDTYSNDETETSYTYKLWIYTPSSV